MLRGKGQDEAVLGVDGGASRTVALLYSLDGRLLGAGEAGPANHLAVGEEAAAQAVLSAVRAARVPGWAVRAACLTLAGFAGPTLSHPLLQGVAEACACPLVRGDHDAAAGLYLLEPGPGVAVVAGTGSVVLGVGPDGRRARAGGYGPGLLDGGSGYRVGLSGLEGALRARDGLPGGSRALLERSMAHLGEGWPEGLLEGRAPDPVRVAGFARHVVAAARGGDPVARAILGRAAGELAAQVRGVLAQLGGFGWPVIPLGGLLSHSPYLRRSLARRLRGAARLLPVARVPAVGAAAAAAQLAGCPWPPRVRRRAMAEAERWVRARDEGGREA